MSWEKNSYSILIFYISLLPLLEIEITQYVPTKFHQNPSSRSGEEFENVKSLQTDGQVGGKRAARYDNSPLEPSAQVS